MLMLAIVINQKFLTKSEEGEMSDIQRKEKRSNSPSTHDLSIQKIVLWNLQMKFPTF